MPDSPNQQDSAFTESDIENWAAYFGWSSADSAYDLGLGLANGVVSIIDSSDQAKRNRNRAKAILQIGSSD